MVDFPAPLAPRMIFVWPGSSVKLTSRRMTLSSKASDTLSKTIGRPVRSGPSFELLRVANRVGRHQYNSVISTRVTKKSTAITATDAATTALVVARPTPCVPPVVRKPDVTADRDDHEAEEERLDQPHPRILQVERLGHRRPVEARRHAKLIDGDQPAADDADRIGDDGQDRRHEEAGEHARHDELANRIGAERAQRVDLIGHDHRPELRRDARADAAGEHQARQHRAQLLDHRRADQAADERPRAELIERDAASAAPAPRR